MTDHLEPGTDAHTRSRMIRSLIRSGAIRMAGNKRLRIYGLLSCTSGKQMKARNRIFFATEQEALAAGYRPCGHCMPEKYRMWKAGAAIPAPYS
ncbi:MAG TPA: Ada metal-binding domain-containing protein [Chitinophaga sp.]|uniref:Ada metal-binding domain-containing protein n=1 Tax=Chitinophaga sp. TaxID=1869181 RepID=UPI002DBA5F8F|nr:Ada metal-binding domain-containing protein [Chitinophaga sp.]HEU4554386.1 Ada metal-binding domain-containing protein [Chitinophaga sp.]